VKTRLSSVLTSRELLELTRAFFEDTLSVVRQLPWAAPVIATSESLQGLLEVQNDLPVWIEPAPDFGQMIEGILRRAVSTFGAGIAIGIDSPGLPVSRFEETYRRLSTESAVIGPCEDGGFYLLGLSACPEGLLANLPWGERITLQKTVERLRNFLPRVTLLEPWFDVDRPEDLFQLMRLLDNNEIHALRTKQVLEKFAKLKPQAPLP
jgi:uncharacterized protein